MSRTISISDALYSKLEAAVHKRGLSSIEHLLEKLQDLENRSINHDNAVRRIDELREHLFAKYGEMPDSAELVRNDRTR